MNVSRETFPRLAAFEEIVRQWAPRINLISRGDLDHLWDRHIADSAQIHDIAPPAETWLDFGSGAGFPGLVCAILATDAGNSTRFTLVESDARKCAFLREAARKLDVPVTVVTARIEAMPSTPCDIITARAVAPLTKLLSLAYPHCGPATMCLFPKGVRAESELTEAAADWHTTTERLPSRTDPGASILKITDIARRP